MRTRSAENVIHRRGDVASTQRSAAGKLRELINEVMRYIDSET